MNKLIFFLATIVILDPYKDLKYDQINAYYFNQELQEENQKASPDDEYVQEQNDDSYAQAYYDDPFEVKDQIQF